MIACSDQRCARTTTGALLVIALVAACDAVPSAALPGKQPSRVVVRVTQQAPAPPPPAAREPGINLGAATLDFDRTRLYADVMRTAREFERPGGGAVDLDAHGWPRDDFKLVVWHGIDQMHGRYSLSFQGRATVSAQWADVALSPARYDAATNTSTLTLEYRDPGPTGLQLTFTDTRRGPDSPPRSGITGLRMMRPVSPGAAQSQAASKLFHDAPLALLKKFRVVRFMDYLATNSNQQREWADRAKPSQPSFNRSADKNGYGWQGMGGPWEHVVLLANELDVDIWLNLPVRASDDYIKKLAQLLRYGSDGVNPYSQPQPHPVYPPLKPALRVYVEYGNELWNSAGSIFGDAFRYNQAQAAAEVAAGKSPLAFDGVDNTYYWGWRRVAKRGLEVSTIFRDVFGDDAMMARVRPVLMTQQGNAQETLAEAMKLLHGYYNNGDGDFVQRPRPPGYFFFGAGGSAYYNPDNGSPKLTLDNLWTNELMSVSAWQPMLALDADGAAAMGLRRVAYEGGPSFDRTGNSETVKQAAVRDLRIATSIEEHHRAWGSFGGDLLVYYLAVGDYQWGFAPDALELDTTKLLGIERVRQLAPIALTHGAAIPGSLDGNRFGYSSLDYRNPGAGAKGYSSAAGKFRWGSYTFHTAAPSTRTLQLDLSGASADAKVAAWWNGTLLGTTAVPRGRGQVDFEGVEVPPGLHGVIVRAVGGSFQLEKVSVR